MVPPTMKKLREDCVVVAVMIDALSDNARKARTWAFPPAESLPTARPRYAADKSARHSNYRGPESPTATHRRAQHRAPETQAFVEGGPRTHPHPHQPRLPSLRDRYRVGSFHRVRAASGMDAPRSESETSTLPVDHEAAHRSGG